MNRYLKLFSAVACLGVAQLSFGVSIPFGNGVYLYPGSYDMAPGMKMWIHEINNFNAKAEGNNKISVLYPYGSDLEMACSTSFSPFCKATDNGVNVVGFYYGTGSNGNMQMVSTYKKATCLSGKNSCVATNSGEPTPLTMVPIVDGRVDDGYLQGFKQLTEQEVRSMADLVANGGTSQKQQAVGICDDPNVAGVQMDIEPFSIPTTTSNQYYFYDELGKQLAACNKFYSVFTFAESLTPAAIQVLKKYNNAYVVDSLYDLPAGTNAPVVNGRYCTKGNGCKTAVPRTTSEYKNYAQAEVTAMLKVAVANKLPFKFAIPAAASAHEFVSWYKRGGASFCEGGKKGANAPGCGYVGDLIGDRNSGGGVNQQVHYVQAVMGILKATFNGSNKLGSAALPYFKGIDIWGFSPMMQWTPNPAIHDWNSGKYDGGNDSVIFFPATPTADVLSYLEKNLAVTPAN